MLIKLEDFVMSVFSLLSTGFCSEKTLDWEFCRESYMWTSAVAWLNCLLKYKSQFTLFQSYIIIIYTSKCIKKLYQLKYFDVL